jgi:hypothetical protein
MKKTNIIFGTLICTSLLITSCQQEKEVSPEVMDAKVKEAYEAKIKQIDEEAAAACEAKINEKVQSLKDSLSHVSATQQAALMAKMQKDLEIAKKKAQEVAKKKPSAKPALVPSTKPDNSQNNKPVLDEKGNQKGTATTRGDNTDPNIKKDNQGNQTGTPTTR